VKYYLFVAIDRATRTLYFKIYEAKTSANTEDFMNECLDFFPYGITHVLTDNGLEFTNRLIKIKKENIAQSQVNSMSYVPKIILTTGVQNLLHLKQMVWLKKQMTLSKRRQSCKININQ